MNPSGAPSVPLTCRQGSDRIQDSFTGADNALAAPKGARCVVCLLPRGNVPSPEHGDTRTSSPRAPRICKTSGFAPPVSPYLGFDADLHDGSQDGEDVADHQENVPAVEEFHAVRQAHALVVTALEEPAELLRGEEKRGPLPTAR